MVKQTATAKKSAISMKDLMGMKLIDIERVSTQQGKNNTLIIVGKVLDEESDLVDSQVKYGIVTKQAVDAMLNLGRQEDDKIILRLPEPDPDITAMNWVNFLPEDEE